MAGGKLSKLALRHSANVVRVAYFETKLKEARAQKRESGMALAKEKPLDHLNIYKEAFQKHWMLIGPWQY